MDASQTPSRTPPPAWGAESSTLSSPPPPVPPPPARAGGRRWVHGLLFASTVVTATLAGSWFWLEAFQSPHELLRHPGLGLVGWPYALALLSILGAHEMGHYLACRKYKIPATLPFFLPGLPPFGTFGAVIRIRAPIPDRVALFDVAAAGPIAGFAVALPILCVALLQAVADPSPPRPGELLLGIPLVSSLLEALVRPEAEPFFRPRSLYGAAWVGMLVTSMNLFPVGQLDGGHAAYAVSRRLHRVLSRLTIVGLSALVLWQAVALQTIPAYAFWLVVLFFMRDRHPRLTDETLRLGPGRTLVAALLALLFVLTFIPLPLMVQ